MAFSTPGATLLSLALLQLLAAESTTLQLDLSLRSVDKVPDDLCSRNATAVNLCINKLTVVPHCCASFQRLYLYRNEIRELPNHWLQSCSHLQELSVSRNQLQQLPGDLLSTAHSLRRLQASGNYLQAVPDGLLDSATSLQVLDLSQNCLSELPSGFLHKTTQLVELYLQANSLSAIAEDLLVNCKKLKVLRLSENRLERIPASLFAYSPRLRILHLDQNNISDIARGAFDNNQDLQLVDLSRNSIEILPEGLFAKTTSLRRLLLLDNHLTVVPAVGISQKGPVFLDVSYNELEAVEDCRMFNKTQALVDCMGMFNKSSPISVCADADVPTPRWFSRWPVCYNRTFGHYSMKKPHVSSCELQSSSVDGTNTVATTDVA